MPYQEETTFTITLRMSAEFDDDYEGDDDGWAWLGRLRSRALPRLLTAVFAALRAEPGFRVVQENRGHDPDTQVEIRIERVAT